MSEHYRSGSKRGQIYAAFKTGGLEEALKVGLSLNWSESGIRSWAKKWQGGSTQSTTINRTGKKQVRLAYWPEKVGTVEVEGPEVSGVKFNDGTHRFIPNRDLENV